MRNIKGLLETVEAQRPSDAVAGEVTHKTGLSFYPRTLTHLESLKVTVGINNRSQLIRAIIDFTKTHEDEFAEFLASSSSEVKAG